jgi:hypothetical protein
MSRQVKKQPVSSSETLLPENLFQGEKSIKNPPKSAALRKTSSASSNNQF